MTTQNNMSPHQNKMKLKVIQILFLIIQSLLITQKSSTDFLLLFALIIRPNNAIRFRNVMVKTKTSHNK